MLTLLAIQLKVWSFCAGHLSPAAVRSQNRPDEAAASARRFAPKLSRSQ